MPDVTEAVNELDLEGLKPRPLISYLKALGVLRLVAEQKDPEAAAGPGQMPTSVMPLPMSQMFAKCVCVAPMTSIQ